MKIRFNCRRIVTACLVLGALLSFAGAAPGADENEKVTYADIKGRVVDAATGEPVPGAIVSLLFESVIADEEGKFSFLKIPTVHTSIISMQVATETGVVIGCTSFDIPVKYYPLSAADGDYVDVAIVEPGVDKFVELKLKNIPIGEVDNYCVGCHENNPCADTSTFGEVSKKKDKKMRGLVVKESELPKVREEYMELGLSKETYRSIRFGDTHKDNMDMNEMVTEVGLKAGLHKQPEDLRLHVYEKDDIEYRIVKCDTCHSRHVPTPYRQFVLMAFDEESELCYQCHK